MISARILTVMLMLLDILFVNEDALGCVISCHLLFNCAPPLMSRCERIADLGSIGCGITSYFLDLAYMNCVVG